MSDYYTVQEVGGADLAEHYPDRGLIADADWHRAVLSAEKNPPGSWRIFRKRERFFAVLSANADGLRILVSLNKFAVFIPWSEVSVTAERSMPGTTVRLQTAAVPSVSLEFHVDDAAADALFSRAMQPLPRRDPPGRLYWPKPWATKVLLAVMLVSAGTLAFLPLSPTARFAATIVTGFAIWLLWIACRPVFEENR